VTTTKGRRRLGSPKKEPRDLAELLLAIAADAGERWGPRIRDFAATVPPGVSVVGSAERARARRNAALRRLAIDLFLGLDLKAVADELAKDVRRYGSIAWCRDQHRSEMPARYAGDPLRAGLFEAFKATDGDVPTSPKQMARVLKPLFLQQHSGHRSGIAMSRSPMSPRVEGKQQMIATVLKLDPKASAERIAKHLLQAVADSPEGKKAHAVLEARTLADRERLAAELAGLDKQELAAIEAQGAGHAKAIKELAAARAKVKELENKVLASAGAKIGSSFSFQSRRDALQRQLKETAHPAIAAFIHQMQHDEMEKLRKEQPRVNTTRTRSAITGKFVGSETNNLAAIVIRMHACRRAAEDAEALYFQPDQSTVPAQLGELLRNLPGIDEMRPPPRYGSHLLLNDLRNGMDLKEALSKHC